MNAPWWRPAADSRQTTNDRTTHIESVDDFADLLPPFYD